MWPDEAGAAWRSRSTKREVIKLKAERDILGKSAAYFMEGIDVKFGSIAKHRGIWPADWLCVGRTGALAVGATG